MLRRGCRKNPTDQRHAKWDITTCFFRCFLNSSASRSFPRNSLSIRYSFPIFPSASSALPTFLNPLLASSNFLLACVHDPTCRSFSGWILAISQAAEHLNERLFGIQTVSYNACIVSVQFLSILRISIELLRASFSGNPHTK